MASRIFFHPVTLFALMYGLGEVVRKIIARVAEPVLSGSSEAPLMALSFALFTLFVTLVYPVLLGWYVVSIPSRPGGTPCEGPTSRIHHPLSLLIFPVWTFGYEFHGLIDGLFYLDHHHSGRYDSVVLVGFVFWWVIPVEWWEVLHRGFMRERPKWTQTVGEPAIMRVVRVALVGSGLRSGDAPRPSLASPSRVAEPDPRRGEGFHSEAFKELAWCLSGTLLGYVLRGLNSGVW